MMTGARRRVDRLTRRIDNRVKTAAATLSGGQAPGDPEHVLSVFLGMIECGAWTIEEAAARVGLSAAELRDALAAG